MADLETTDFIEPYPQEALDGELGLTAVDIAKALGITPDQVRKKVKRDRYAKLPEFLAKPYGVVNEINGLFFTEYAFSVKAAKVFVARWGNLKGDGFLNYLFECERKAEKELPKLISAFKALSDRYLKPKKKQTHVTVTRMQHRIDMFDLPYWEIIEDKIPREDLDSSELESWRFTHRQKIMNGISKKQLESLEGGKVIPFSNNISITAGDQHHDR